MSGAGIEVSLFIDPDPWQVERAAELEAGLIEINTNAYSEAVPLGLNEADAAFQKELEKVVISAEMASQRELRVLAGHGLTYRNVRPVSDAAHVEELNIGHNLIARATLVGMERAVREMLLAMNG